MLVTIVFCLMSIVADSWCHVLVCVCCCRTCVFQIFYMLLVAVFHAVVIYDGLHVMLMADPHGNHLRWVFVLLFTNLWLYIICCLSNPGELVADGQLLQQSLVSYPYDDILYQPRRVCSTCNIVKPARSKHCSKYRVSTAHTHLYVPYVSC